MKKTSREAVAASENVRWCIHKAQHKRSRPPTIQDEFFERMSMFVEFRCRYEFLIENRKLFEVEHDVELLSPLRGCMGRRIDATMGENAHGYMLAPLRGEVYWDRNFQKLEVRGAKCRHLFPACCSVEYSPRLTLSVYTASPW